MHRLHWAITAAVLMLGLLSTRTAAAPLDVELEELRPGLLAVWSSPADKDATLSRIEPKPSFYLGHSSPHPRIPQGPFEVVWKGVLLLKEPSPIAFDAFAGGEVTVEVDGVTVLQGRGTSDTSRITAKAPLNREPGFYRISIRYRSLPDVPARLQVGWEGPSFAREPLPAWQLKHLAAEVSASAKQDELAAQGRAAVGRLGCARCHAGAFPGVTEPPPGPSLADVGRRVSRAWLMHWLENPAKVRPGARMPALFTPDRQGFIERWIIAENLIRDDKRPATAATGDHRKGRLEFLSIGCVACHFVPDIDRKEQADLERRPLFGLGDRMKADDIAAFLGNPHGRYPDGRMPRLPVAPEAARDIAAYLLLWLGPSPEAPVDPAPTAEEIAALGKRLGARGQVATANALLREKGCASCHPGLGATLPADVPLAADKRGCVSGQSLPSYSVDAETSKAIAAYQAIAAKEKHPSSVESRRKLVERAGCVRCHQRDSDRPPPLEVAGSTLGTAWLQALPFQRTPRLTLPHQKYTRAHLIGTVREGITGLRLPRYTYRMPAFGTDAEALVQALAEADGELPAAADAPVRPPDDPTVATLTGPVLAGFQGYACVSCHLWNGQLISEADPGAVGTDLTRVAGRIRRDWFDRFLDDPARSHPGTPMPAIFRRGKPALLASVLDGDPARQKEALWSYFALGKSAPSPKPPPPVPVAAPAAGERPVVALVPIRLPNGSIVESVTILYGSHDGVIHDLASGALHSVWTGAQILRHVQGRLRYYTLAGTPLGDGFAVENPLQLIVDGKAESPTELTLLAYDSLPDRVRLEYRARFTARELRFTEQLQVVGADRRFLRTYFFNDVPAGTTLALRSRVPEKSSPAVRPVFGQARWSTAEQVFTLTLTPNERATTGAELEYRLPAAQTPPAWNGKPFTDTASIDGPHDRPGYKVINYPRPKTIAGEDLIMPGAVAVNPRDGRVFIASMKMGEIFVLRDPHDNGKDAHFENYAHGLFQEAYSMLAEEDALYVLHRRNLTRIRERGSHTLRFERVAALPHGVADTYDYGYGLVRDRTGGFILSYAPYANTKLPGSGGAVRLLPGKPPQEVAFGFRNPLGWCAGPEGEVFFTDNQGEWVATNKLSHIVEGRFYGFPNQAQKQHTTKPFGKPAVWVPYGWARSINGVTYDNTGGKFGPFAGQFFMAELMFGGAIIRANVEKVNGEYQGACFPFWEKGLLGPLTLAFDPKGRLFVGSITEPGWMAQPDRGALFRIDWTGQTPFEIQSIHALPRGFRLVFTSPVAAESARDPASYQVEHYRYEYTGAYGSPELDRTRSPVERVVVAADGRSVELTTAPLVKDRVYLISTRGVRSAKGEAPVHPTGAYTLNEIPDGKK